MSGSLLAFGVFWCIVCGFSVCDVKGSSPENKNEHIDGFWFGKQSITCMKSKPGAFLPPGISKRSVIYQDSPDTSGYPSRYSLLYKHRLIFYRGTTFEWGTGVQGHHVGDGASVRDCPVTWERLPAGESHCPVSKVVNFTSSYRGRFGPYNLLTNNCHHFANRVSKLLSKGNCAVDSTIGKEDGVVTRGEKLLSRMVNYFLSLVSRDPEETKKPEIDESQIIT